MRNDIAIQMYSLKDITKVNYLDGFKLAADLGFKNIELAGNYGLGADEFKAVCDEYGLKVISAHVGGWDNNTEELKGLMAFHRTIGNDTIVCPHSRPETLEETIEIAKSLKARQDILEGEGFAFGFHNHAYEFKKIDGDKRIIDIYAEHGVKLQPDIHWVKAGGYDPLSFMKQYSDLVISLHFKEYGEGNTNPEFGTGGVLDWQAIMNYGKELGVKYNILEQEQYTLPVPDSIALCAKNLEEMFK